MTSLDDFTSLCGEIRNLRARELVIGYALSEEEEQVFSNQMNLLLSFEDEVTEDVQLIDNSLTDLEKAAAGKLLSYLHRTQMRDLSHLQEWSTMKSRTICKWTMQPSPVWTCLKTVGQARSMVVCTGC